VTDVAPVVLVVEDEEQMRTYVRIALESHGYQMLEAPTAGEGIRQARAHAPDIVILDLGLPDADGSTVTRRIREYSRVPILVISARGNEESKVKALDEGANDYLTKPFGAAELMARIRVALRNVAARDVTAVVRLGDDVEIDLERRSVTRLTAREGDSAAEEEVHLTPMEFKLLASLVRNAGNVQTHHQLLDEVWGPGHENQMQYLRVYMTQLRHKLEREPARPRYLLTETGIGYRLRTEA
jgi:two-component system KDP operon response regulator KdpE